MCEIENYEYEEVYNKTLEYFRGDELATNVWISKYCSKSICDDGITHYHELTPYDMHIRLAKEFYRVGLNYKNPLSYEEILELFVDFKYVVAQGRPMAGIGVVDMVSLSNCFVVGKPGQDSYGTIALNDQQIMQLSKRGGGCGTDISDYRPNNAKVTNAAKISSGPVDICAKRFSNTIREVGQCGRRGALMISMDVNHPDAEKFIDAKTKEGEITGANISVKIYDEWMKQVVKNSTIKDVEKERIWKKITHNAWKSAEPGVLFWSTVLKESVPDCYEKFGFKTFSTNPCGEIPLSPYDSCRLMLLVLSSYVEQPFTLDATFNFKKFSSHAKKIMKLMDNMIDLEIEKIDRIINKIKHDPEDEITKMIELDLWENIKKSCLLGRRSGIGITAEGDMLAMMGLKYGTKEATEFAVKVQKVLSLSCYIESCDLTQRDDRKQFGCFDWSLESQNPFLNRLITLDEQDAQDEFLSSLKGEFKGKWKNGRRNIALLTIAPAGSVSCLTQTTSGIENLFLPMYKRKRKIEKKEGVKPDFIDKTGDWFEEFNVIHYPIIQWYSIVKNISFEESKAILEKMGEGNFNVLFMESPYYNTTSNDCDWVEKVRMQGAIQKYVDHSISITVNLPKGTSEELVRDVYETAWIEGCKGCTIYVDGSRDGVLTAKSNKDCDCKGFRETEAPRRPKVLPCKMVRFSNNKEKWVALVGLMDGKPYEVFTGLLDKLNIPLNVTEGVIFKNKIPKEVYDEEKGKMVTISDSRYDFIYKNLQGEELKIEGINTVFDKKYWDFGKLISGNLRHGMPIEFLVKMLIGLKSDDDGITTWKMGVCRALKSFLKDGETGELCPECGSKMVRESGCVGCKQCGHSKCG